MTQSKLMVLTGVLTIAVAGILPLLPAFGEGGARRDVVLHEQERGTMNIIYLVEFEASKTGATTSREQTIERLDTLVIPTLERLGKESKIRAGGITVNSLAGIFLVEAKSKDEVDEFVRTLPAWDIMQWKVRPLETFGHRADIEKKTVQELRTSK